MGEWLEKTLGELTSYMAKGIPPKYVEAAGKETIRVLNQKCNRNYRISYAESRLHDNSVKKAPEDKMLRDFDVLVNSTGTGTAGRVAQIWHVPEPTTLDGHMILMRPTEEIDPLYYGYAIKSFQAQVESFAEGSTGQTEINKRRLQDEVVIRFPVSQDKQKAVGRMLKSIDEKIQNNEEINENLQEQAQTIFCNMFPEIFSSNGETTLDQLIVFSNGKKRPQVSGNIPVYGGNGILAYTSDANAENCVIIGRVGAYCGNTFLCTGKCWVSDNAIQAKSKNSKSQLFIFYLLSNAALPSRHIGTGQPLMTQGILNAIPILLPEQSQTDLFNEIVDPIHKIIDKNNAENKFLANIRDTLLTKLMSGEIDVSQVKLTSCASKNINQKTRCLIQAKGC